MTLSLRSIKLINGDSQLETHLYRTFISLIANLHLVQWAFHLCSPRGVALCKLSHHICNFRFLYVLYLSPLSFCFIALIDITYNISFKRNHGYFALSPLIPTVWTVSATIDVHRNWYYHGLECPLAQESSLVISYSSTTGRLAILNGEFVYYMKYSFFSSTGSSESGIDLGKDRKGPDQTADRTALLRSGAVLRSYK